MIEVHHRISRPRTGSIVHLRIGDTLEVQLPQRAARHPWQVTLRPYGVDLLEDAPRSGTSGRDTTRRLMFRAMLGAGGILRLSESSHPNGDAVDLLLTVAP